MPSRVAVLVICGILAILTAAEAQINPGDIIFAKPDQYSLSGGIGVINAVSGLLTTLANTRYSTYGLVPTADGTQVYTIAYQEAQWSVFPTVVRFDPASGAATSLHVLASKLAYHFPAGLFRDQDGGVTFVDADRSKRTEVWRIDASGVSLRASLAVRVTGMTRDADSGDYFLSLDAGYQNPTHLARMSPAWKITTIATGVSGPLLAQDVVSGNLWHYDVWGMRLLDRQSGVSLTSIRLAPAVTWVTTDDITGGFLVESHYGSRLSRLARDGTVLRIFSLRGLGGADGLMVWGARPLIGSGPATPGSRYGVNLHFPASPARSYLGAASLSGLRPRIPYPTGGIPIAMDGLFLWTLGRDIPGLTSGFSGKLDSKGRGRMEFTIPIGVPRGLLITVAAAAINPTRPALLDVGSSITVAVR